MLALSIMLVRGESMGVEFEYEFLRERLREIRSRLARRDRLDLHELSRLKTEASSIEKALKDMRPR